MRAAVIYKGQRKTDLKPLNISAWAAIEVAGRFGCKPDPSHRVNLETFQQEYQESDIVIIGTHGLANGASAWESNIELREPLRVLDLVQLRSHATLVVFEACVSGVGEGAGAFLGALWEVSDKASTMLMSFLFRELTATVSQDPAEPPSLAACQRRAQIRLYQSDARIVKAVLEDFKVACVALDPAQISPFQLRKISNVLHTLVTTRR
ncbi:hypothetical protein ACHAPJ_012145 [Fusarium lateritium]